MTEVSVVIVTWNNENDIDECLESIGHNLSDIDGEIIIVDNNSKDRTIEKLEAAQSGSERITVIRNNSNEGYTKAMNTAIGSASGKNVLILNPDVKLNGGCIGKLDNFLDENDEYGACCPKLLNEDGSVQYSLRNFPDYGIMLYEFTLLSYLFSSSKVFGKWRMKYFDYNEDTDVSQPMAAALMVRKSMLDKLENMDERFVMFFSDVDLCKRVIDNGEKIRYMSTASAVHKKGSSIYQDRVRMIKTWNSDCIKYFQKHHKNVVLLLWLRINLKVSEIIRILWYKVKRQT